MMIPRTAVVSLFFAAIACPALAQDQTPPPTDRPSGMLDLYEPAWSSPEIAQIARRFTGTWRTEDPIESMQGEDGQSKPVYIVMSIAPAPVQGMSDTFYVESARTDSPWAPYRRAIFQIYPYKDGHRLRTLELAVGKASLGVFNGMTAAAEHFPDLSADELIATIDLDLTPTDTGFTGKTPYPFPTRIGGAVEMTSELTLDEDVLTVADRGYDADGNIVWGADENGLYLFERAQGVAAITRREDGMVILDYGGASGPIVANGDQMSVHYEGFTRNKTRFQTSYDRGTPFTFPYPPGTRAIVGWGIGMDGLAQGARRKLIIPGDLGFGPNGNPSANIPGNAALYFNIHLINIDRAPPAEDPAAAPTAPAGTED
jgi:FKBP-type peptidyl-prolyl cis-trans isomerase FkpA